MICTFIEDYYIISDIVLALLTPMWKVRLCVITFLCWVMCAQHQRTREHWHTKPVWQIVVGFFLVFFNSLSASRGSRKNTNTPGQTIKPRHPGLHSHVLEDSLTTRWDEDILVPVCSPNNSRRYVTSTPGDNVSHQAGANNTWASATAKRSGYHQPSDLWVGLFFLCASL